MKMKMNIIIDFIKDLFNKDYKIRECKNTKRYFPLYKGQFIFKNKDEYRLTFSKMGCENSTTKSGVKKLIRNYKKSKKVMENI